MACVGCSCSTGKDSTPKGCGSGGCATGGCNKRNTYDWITAMGIQDAEPFDMVEVSFKNGARKEFFKNPSWARATTGDWVMVDTGGGFDIGKVALSGELVRLQMKKKHVREDFRFNAVVRTANERDMERFDEIRGFDQPTMVKARAIGRMLNMDMKISDVEYQADGRKATFYYTAQGRIDFRELIRHYAKEFRVKIEMRQIGARQETARLGGLGPCGRELCCSTWLTDFKSVSTAAARYQNIAINQTKLSGQCGRLKCCLNYELDTYLDALEDFPDHADRIPMANGKAILIKTDVFKRIMFYAVEGERGKLYVLSVDTVKDIIAKAKRGERLDSLNHMEVIAEPTNQEEENDYEAVNDVLELPEEEKRKKKKKKKPSENGENRPQQMRENRPQRDENPPQNQPKNPNDRQNRPAREDRPVNPNQQKAQNRPQNAEKTAENQPENQQPKVISAVIKANTGGQKQPPNPQNRPPQNIQPNTQNAENDDQNVENEGEIGQNQPKSGGNRNNRNRNRNRGPRRDNPGAPPPSA
jgi:cell fate regulator YaaT (PSP1 superfamily)